MPLFPERIRLGFFRSPAFFGAETLLHIPEVVLELVLPEAVFTAPTRVVDENDGPGLRPGIIGARPGRNRNKIVHKLEARLFNYARQQPRRRQFLKRQT